MIYFEKYHGTGNDFIILDGMKEHIEDGSRLAVKMCDRHFGIGADGLIISEKAPSGNYFMRFYNADGSVAPMCGNGIRCFAKYLFEHNIITQETFNIDTLAGVMKVELTVKNHQAETVRINMGKPLVENLHQELTVLDKTFDMSVITMGTYHGVIFTDDFSIDAYAPLLAKQEMFKNGINVNFCRVIDENHLKVRTYERGVGFTLSCGTGSSATAVISKILNGTADKVTVSIPGGELEIEQINDNVYLKGAAVFICSGYYNNV